MNAPRQARRRRSTGRNFYRQALEAAAQESLDAAASTEGLDDEVALLRMIVRRELAEQPADLRLVMQGLTLLVRTVAARYRINPSDQQALEGRIVEAVRTLTESIEQEAGDA